MVASRITSHKGVLQGSHFGRSLSQNYELELRPLRDVGSAIGLCNLSIHGRDVESFISFMRTGFTQEHHIYQEKICHSR